MYSCMGLLLICILVIGATAYPDSIGEDNINEEDIIESATCFDVSIKPEVSLALSCSEFDYKHLHIHYVHIVKKMQSSDEGLPDAGLPTDEGFLKNDYCKAPYRLSLEIDNCCMIEEFVSLREARSQCQGRETCDITLNATQHIDTNWWKCRGPGLYVMQVNAECIGGTSKGRIESYTTGSQHFSLAAVYVTTPGFPKETMNESFNCKIVFTPEPDSSVEGLQFAYEIYDFAAYSNRYFWCWYMLETYFFTDNEGWQMNHICPPDERSFSWYLKTPTALVDEKAVIYINLRRKFNFPNFSTRLWMKVEAVDKLNGIAPGSLDVICDMPNPQFPHVP